MKKDHPLKGKAICIDFDGVIHKYSKGYQGEIYDKPIKGSKKALKELIDRGYHLIIYTAYPKPKEIKPWMRKYYGNKVADNIEVIGGKPPAMMYIDDRGIRFTNWIDMLNYLR